MDAFLAPPFQKELRHLNLKYHNRWYNFSILLFFSITLKIYFKYFILHRISLVSASSNSHLGPLSVDTVSLPSLIMIFDILNLTQIIEIPVTLGWIKIIMIFNTKAQSCQLHTSSLVDLMMHLELKHYRFFFSFCWGFFF